MARKRISEFRAKTILAKAFNITYSGLQVNDDHPLQKEALPANRTYVVKVDQGIKGRFKKGLVLLNQQPSSLPSAIQILRNKGYSQYIIEEMQEHGLAEEKYLSFSQMRHGYQVLYSSHGGIHVEQHQKEMLEQILPYDTNDSAILLLAEHAKVPVSIITTLIHTIKQHYFTFLEINPFILSDSSITILYAAVEVDTTGGFFVHNAWLESDYTDNGTHTKTPEEHAVTSLAAKSQAAFSLEVLNPDGAIFMMLSGGGASIVLADEVHNQGFGKQLANYGEYSGNPNAEETYLYAKQILQLLIRSKAPKKTLIIAGGVANFTDIRITFEGLIKALAEVASILREQHVTIFVRRGGPYQIEGLTRMKYFLENEKLQNMVTGPEMMLTDSITHALKELRY